MTPDIANMLDLNMFYQSTWLHLAMTYLLYRSKVLTVRRLYLGFMSGIFAYSIYFYITLIMGVNFVDFGSLELREVITTYLLSLESESIIYSNLVTYAKVFIFIIPCILVVFFTFKYNDSKISCRENIALTLLFGTNIAFYFIIIATISMLIFILLALLGFVMLDPPPSRL